MQWKLSGFPPPVKAGGIGLPACACDSLNGGQLLSCMVITAGKAGTEARPTKLFMIYR
jgi:hypothetical protein